MSYRMYCLEDRICNTREEPSASETERYYHYVENCIPLSAICPMPADTLIRVEKERIPLVLLGDNELQSMKQNLKEEVS